MIKSGASPSAARAAKAHTGALVGEDRVFDAVLQECGVIRVTSVEAFVDVALMLADVFPGRMPHGSGVGIVTFGGGNGVLAADQAQEYGLTTPSAQRRLRRALAAVAPRGRHCRESPRPDAQHRIPRRGARPAAGGARRVRGGAADSLGDGDRRLACIAGARDHRRDPCAARSNGQAGLRGMAVAAVGCNCGTCALRHPRVPRPCPRDARARSPRRMSRAGVAPVTTRRTRRSFLRVAPPGARARTQRRDYGRSLSCPSGCGRSAGGAREARRDGRRSDRRRRRRSDFPSCSRQSARR